MSDRSRSASAEGSGDEIRPHGDDHDSSEESEDDPEGLRQVAEGFIVDEDDDDEEGSHDEDPEERRRRRKEKKKQARRRERRERKQREAEELSEDELELINENRGIAGPSSSRPLKRLRRRSGSEGEGEGDGEIDGRRGPTLNDMFADDEDRFDEDEDDMGDFIEDDEEAGPDGETEQERKDRRREEKVRRRQQLRARPDVVDKGTWDEMFDVLGDGHEYDWALAGEEGIQMEDEGDVVKKTTELRLEQVFDPSEIKARRLQEEDKTIALLDIPERHQLMNSTLSDNPILALSSDPSENLYPPPDLAARYAYDKISLRTQFLFCELDVTYPPINEAHLHAYPPIRRKDLEEEYQRAVSAAIHMMFNQHYEVPYIWHYKRDALSKLENQGQSAVQFLERDELWTLYNLGIKFKAVYERVLQIRDTWSKIKARRPGIENTYLTQQLLESTSIMGIESASEVVDWLAYHYASDIRNSKEEESIEPGRTQRRLPERLVQEDLRVGPIMELVKAFGMDVSRVAVDFNGNEGVVHPPKDSERLPVDIAQEFSGSGTPFLTPEDALQAARDILVVEMIKDPSIRQQTREFIKELAEVTVTPTDRGMTVIDQYHMYHTFKFLTSKPVRDFADTPQWLHILKAEEEGLITISIDVPEALIANFAGALERCCVSVDYGEVATKWNELRKEVCQDAVRKHLIGIGSKWVKEYLRSQAEDFVAERCRMELEFRVNVRPYTAHNMEIGDTPSVLALTNGKGEIRDAVIAILLDDYGTIRTQTKFDNLRGDADREALKEIIQRHKPKVIALGGLSIQTAKLRDDVMAILRDLAMTHIPDNPPVSDAYQSHDEFTEALRMFDEKLRPYMVPFVMPSDATARMYMNSEDAEKEHPALPINARYALALARYVQNPLNAYCKLGKRILDITFMEYHQKLISQEKLLINLERGLVNSVCGMGIELSTCVLDPYQRTMMPFISGLGPRKADALIQAVLRTSNIINRGQLVDLNVQNPILGPVIGTNVLGFLSIEHNLDDVILEENNPETQPDPLDCTRIHPSDYEFAQKMSQDALDLDSEDVEGQHRSEAVLKLMRDPDRARKIGELNLDDFAFNLQSQGEGNKRHILGEIVNELISYRADRRPKFYEPTDWEVVQMLTGETERSIARGMRVSATVRKALQSRAFCQLESGIDAILEREFVRNPEGVQSCEEVLSPRQNINAVIIQADPQRFQVRISTRTVDLEQGHSFSQPFADDPYNNVYRRQQAEDAAASKKRRQAGKVKRVVNHPNWHIMNSGQAEQFLASQPRGEVVIRPSSKGNDHLALTFKLDEDVFQHVDIQEIDKPNEYSLGKILRIGGKYSFGDLDDVIVNYVKAIMRMLEEAERSEKFRPEAELESFLKNTLLAFPNRSMYGFCLDSDRPGYLRLCFLAKSTKDGGQIQTWPVRLLPGAYALNNAEVPGMNELCNAFKAQYSSRLMDQGMGGKTPGIRAGKTPGPGGRTPAPGMGGRTPAPGVGGATPYGAGVGRTPMRPGMTPNPYMAGNGLQGRPPGMGGATPAQGGYPGQAPNGGVYPPQSGYAGMPPPAAGYPAAPPPGAYGVSPRPPAGGASRPPLGMNPERAAMLARQGGGY